MNFSEEQILALAPDESSKKSGKELANPSKWVKREISERARWGECQGSGKLPYQTKIDLANIAFKCSCPSRKLGSISLFLSLIILLSCKNGRSGSETSIIASVDSTAIAITDSNQQVSEDGLIAGEKEGKENNANAQKGRITSSYILQSGNLTDTLTIYEDSYDPTSKYGPKWVYKKGKINDLRGINNTDSYLVARSETDSSRMYLLGVKPVKHEADSIEALTILVCKNHAVVSENCFNDIDLRFMILGDFKFMDGIQLDGVDEIFQIGYGRGECGHGYHNQLFIRKEEKLFKSISLFSDGEIEYDEKEIIPADQKNQIWVKRKVGTYESNVAAQVFYTEILKYKLEHDSLVLLNPKKDDFRYVHVKSGLKVRSLPYLDTDNDFAGEVLKFGDRVNVLNKTGIQLTVDENGNPISGFWVEIEYEGYSKISENHYKSKGYVFEKYLSKEPDGTN